MVNGLDPSGRILVAYTSAGDWHLVQLDDSSGQRREIQTPFRTIGHVRVGDGFAVFLGGGPSAPSGLVRLDLASGQTDILRHSSEVRVPSDCISAPRSIEFPTEAGLTAFAYYYSPKNRAFTGPVGAKPPLLVLCHGGPTAATSASFNLGIQYFTSRGFAIVDVNYGGSSGYGRAYRERLKGRWGIVDVDDAVNAARFLIAQGLVSDSALAIRGGSAGGYTTLAALVFRSFFKAGASYYGIGDLETLTKDTHKFESRYLDLLVGPYPALRDLYYQRSPVNFVERLSCPMILFQGLDDKVVPPNQAQEMYEAVKAKHLPVALLTFEHEGHGFRAAETIKRAREAELYFYGKVFGFSPADEIEPVTIDNIPATDS